MHVETPEAAAPPNLAPLLLLGCCDPLKSFKISFPSRGEYDNPGCWGGALILILMSLKRIRIIIRIRMKRISMATWGVGERALVAPSQEREEGGGGSSVPCCECRTNAPPSLVAKIKIIESESVKVKV